MARRTLQGCRGILTGASSGIGRALAEQLVAQGASLVVVARRVERLEELARSLAAAPGRIVLCPGDITLDAVRRLAIAQAEKELGGLDLLVNNAGSGAMGRFADAPAERLQQVMDVNFFAAAEMIRLAVPVLERGNHPMIVNVGSILGHRGIPFCAEYCASKAALRGLSESIRVELAPRAIDVLLVSPGTTETEFFQRAIDGERSPWPRAHAASAQVVASKTIAAIRRGKREIVLGLPGKLLVWANRLAPGLVDRLLLGYGGDGNRDEHG